MTKNMQEKQIDYKKITMDAYKEHSEEWSEKFKDLMDLNRRDEFQKFISLLNGKKILDLGCGSGDHSVYFKEKGLDVTAIDLSEEMIRLSKNKGVDALLMDIENLKFADKTFDGIWAVTSLLHIQKSHLSKVIKKLNHILKDEGVLFVCVKEGTGEGLIQDKDKTTQRFFAFWEEDELKQLFEKDFVLLDIKKVQLKTTVFLQAFFRKK